MGEIKSKQESVEQKGEEKDEELERARGQIGSIFDQNSTGQERIETFVKKMGPILDSEFLDGESIRKAMESCTKFDKKEEFIKEMMSALEPVLTFKKNNPELFEQLRRTAVMNLEGMKPINDILYYGGRGDYLHIHLAPAGDFGLAKLKGQVLDGLQKLAEIVKNQENIKTIEATSWIVAKNPKLMEKLGFEVQGEIDEEFKQRHFQGDKRKISKATMSREELLKRYLKKEE